MDKELCSMQQEWANRTLTATRNLLPEMEPVSKYLGWKDEERQTLSFLLTATARSTESAILLCAYGQLWDAEILVRSTLEGTMKFAYLLQSLDKFEERHREYSDQLFEIALLKGHRKAQSVLDAVPDPEASSWKSIREVLLPDELFSKLSERYPKVVRRRLETRWGFAGLICELSRSDDPLFRGFYGFAHNYSLASSVQHADMLGTSFALDRERRPEKERDAMHLAHAGRLLSDVMELLFLRLSVGYRFVGANLSHLKKVRSAIEEAGRPFEDAAKQWMREAYSVDHGET